MAKDDSTNDDVKPDGVAPDEVDTAAEPVDPADKVGLNKVGTDEADLTDADLEDADLEDADLEDADLEDADLDEADEDSGAERELSPESALFWSDVEIDPVEVALPSGVGLTLRHYRTVTDDDGDEIEDAEVEEAVFLAHRGKLHLFRSAEGLIKFINSDAPHDLSELESWPQVQRRCRPADVIPIEEDRYELDLVVENLRGGHDVWEPDLLIGAGEFARDVAFACGLDDVLAALGAGSPLDNLDEALRDGGFLAGRKLRKVGAEQAAIGWRSVIGKITAIVEWHD